MIRIDSSLPQNLNHDSAEKPPLTGSVDVSVIAGTETLFRMSTTTAVANKLGEWEAEGAKSPKNGRNGKTKGNDSNIMIFSPK